MLFVSECMCVRLGSALAGEAAPMHQGCSFQRNKAMEGHLQTLSLQTAKN